MVNQKQHSTAPGYWDTYRPTAGEDSPDGRPPADRIYWTQYTGHGPCTDFVGQPRTALEIGAGTGEAGVALTRITGAQVTCVDYSPRQMERARAWWADEPGVAIVEADVLDFLAATDQRWDCVLSDWGAAFFTDPELLLPLVLPRLTPGGVFAFAAVEPLAPCFGLQIVFANGYRGRPLPIVRWMLSNEQWTAALERHGFVDIDVHTLPGPEPDLVGTQMGRAHASGGSR